jgi:N-methylhydantoinase B
VQRVGEKVVFDFTGTDPQAEGPINFYLNIRMFKMLAGAYMISLYDPEILFNDGYIPLFEVVMPEGCLLHPRRPAALGSRTHTMCRWYDVLAGALSQNSPEFATAAGWSSSPHLIFSGYDADGDWFTLFEIGCGGIPGRPVGDGLDGHTMWPWFRTIPVEYMETYYPLRVVRRRTIIDSGGAGFHRGGNGVEVVYEFLVETEVAVMDDRWLTSPWGINGGKPGERGRRYLIRRGSDERTPLPAKVDHVMVGEGDQLVFRTWGGGGWGDPLTRPIELVQRDVARQFVSPEKAERDYGVVIDRVTGTVDVGSSTALRQRMVDERDELPAYDFGRPLEEVVARCKEETGLDPPQPPRSRGEFIVTRG